MNFRVRAYIRCLHFYQTTKTLIDAVFSGFWLAMLTKKDLIKISSHYYEDGKSFGDQDYSGDDYNRSGFLDWELPALEKFFPKPPASLVVVGAGGGREVLALARKGYVVTGWECVHKLVAAAQRLLSSEGFPASVYYAAPDQCPQAQISFSGGFIGWGAYMLIKERTCRVALLKQLAAQLVVGSPLLLSFFVRQETDQKYHIAAGVSGIICHLTQKTRPELGDYLATDFVHYFTQGEIESELAEAGFDLIFFRSEPYGHAVARLKPSIHQRGSELA